MTSSAASDTISVHAAADAACGRSSFALIDVNYPVLILGCCALPDLPNRPVLLRSLTIAATGFVADSRHRRRRCLGVEAQIPGEGALGHVSGVPRHGQERSVQASLVMSVNIRAICFRTANAVSREMSARRPPWWKEDESEEVSAGAAT